jgi:FtsP/CotA-like multicopper oxidase with cupredoxin domain
MKLVGGDSGRVEREQFVDSVVISPSERAVVDVLFEQHGQLTLEHRTPERTFPLATIDVGAETATPSLTEEFEALRHNVEWVAERERLASYFDARPDKTLALLAEMEMGEHERGVHGEQHHHSHHGHGHGAAAGGIEWEDEMVDVNRMTTPANMRWKLVDREAGVVNHEIDWQFRVGDKVKIRLVNELASDHPMHHPIHIHGAGRFVVLDRDGTPEENLAWKDTVLVRTGETVDILLDVTNPGRWMVHCHIAEHHESGMMFSFDVAPADGKGR